MLFLFYAAILIVVLGLVVIVDLFLGLVVVAVIVIVFNVALRNLTLKFVQNQASNR